MEPALATGYKAPPQIARVVTEGWFAKFMYCPACPSPRLEKTRDNTRVVDFVCANCRAEYQLKAKAGPLTKRLRDAAYQPMRERVLAGRSPHFVFLLYDRSQWQVNSLLLVPGHFLTINVIEACPPLRETARRAGWVGCNILTEFLPNEGKVLAVDRGAVCVPSEVRAKWRRFAWLSKETAETREWTGDVLLCLQRIVERRFTLEQVYAFQGELAERHPRNQNIQAKIRQQLQILRDKGVLNFLGCGTYELK
ncbi:MAG: DpnI domain-containing protein [Planctomycetota bacterium]